MEDTIIEDGNANILTPDIRVLVPALGLGLEQYDTYVNVKNYWSC